MCCQGNLPNVQSSGCLFFVSCVECLNGCNELNGKIRSHASKSPPRPTTEKKKTPSKTGMAGRNEREHVREYSTHMICICLYGKINKHVHVYYVPGEVPS